MGAAIKEEAEKILEKAANSNVVSKRSEDEKEELETIKLLEVTNAIDNAEMNKETRAERIAKARKQPKSPEEEKKLAERYGSMPLEERAFNILLDLGMVELTPDPDDPSYDDTLDIDNENIIVSDKAVDKQKPAVENAVDAKVQAENFVEKAANAKVQAENFVEKAANSNVVQIKGEK